MTGVGADVFYDSVLPDLPGLLTAGAFMLAAAVLARISEGHL